MSLAGPPPVSTNPFLRLAEDLRKERSAPVAFPPGDTRPSRAIAKSILPRWDLDVVDGYALNVRQMPTIGPRGGLPVRLRARA